MDISYDDPELKVTPSHPRIEVDGEVVDMAKSEYGFKVLAVLARKVTVLE